MGAGCFQWQRWISSPPTTTTKPPPSIQRRHPQFSGAQLQTWHSCIPIRKRKMIHENMLLQAHFTQVMPGEGWAVLMNWIADQKLWVSACWKMTAASERVPSDSEICCSWNNTCEWESNAAYLIHKCVPNFTSCAVDKGSLEVELHFIYALLRPGVKTEQELGNMMSHLHMCTPMSSHVNTKLTPLLSPVNKNGWVCSVCWPACCSPPVRPPEWFAKWSRRGWRDGTGPVCRGRQNTSVVCLQAAVLKIFRKSLIFHLIFVSINYLNVSTACLAF